MPVFQLPEEILFPKPDLSEPNGLLAMGGDLSPERLLAAYSLGIFPWYSESEPILWWSPDPRLVLAPSQLHVPKSLRKTLKKRIYQVTFDRAFGEVIRRCAGRDRPGQDGTWITPEMIEAYERLHHLGFAHSAEAWEGDQLVGGLYGVSLGGAFFGESMFADKPDASKAAFVTLVRQLQAWDFCLIDCQVTTDHLLRFGAVEIPRALFLERLPQAVQKPTQRGAWRETRSPHEIDIPSGHTTS